MNRSRNAKVTRDRLSKGMSQVLTGNIQAILEAEAQIGKPATRGEKVAEKITGFCGNSTFVWVHVFGFAAWIGCNVALPEAWRWDPVPFSFLTLVVSLEAIFLSSFILITTNRQGATADRRAHLDLQINLLAEQENTKMLGLLEKIADQVGVNRKTDPEIKALQQATHPQKVLKEIDRLIERKENGHPSRNGEVKSRKRD